MVIKVPRLKGLYRVKAHSDILFQKKKLPIDTDLCYVNDPEELFRKYNYLVTWFANTKVGQDLLGIKGEIGLLVPNGYHRILKTSEKEFEAEFNFFLEPIYSSILTLALTKVDLYSPFLKDFNQTKNLFLNILGIPTDNILSVGIYLDVFNPPALGTDASIQGTDAVWATAHDAASGTATNDQGVILCASGPYNIYRTGNSFDTSSIPNDASITSATIELYCLSANFSNTDSTTLDIVGFTPADPASIVGGDYDQFGTTVFAQIALASITQDAYNTFTLDANGRANISLTSYSKFGYRIGRDTANSAPTGDNRCDIQPRTGANPEKLTANYTTTSTSSSTSTSTTSTSTSTTSTSSSTSTTSTSTSSSTSITTSTSSSTSTSTTSTSSSTSTSTSTSSSTSTTSTSSSTTYPYHFDIESDFQATRSEQFSVDFPK